MVIVTQEPKLTAMVATMLDPNMSRTAMTRKQKAELEVQKRTIQHADAKMWSSFGVKGEPSIGLGC